MLNATLTGFNVTLNKVDRKIHLTSHVYLQHEYRSVLRALYLMSARPTSSRKPEPPPVLQFENDMLKGAPAKFDICYEILSFQQLGECSFAVPASQMFSTNR